MSSSNQKNVTFIRDWARKMAQTCGPKVLDVVTEGAASLRWADAIFREFYGPNFTAHCGYLGLKNNVMERGLDIPDAIVERARSWQAGEWPVWARSGKLESNVFKDKSGEETVSFIHCYPARLEDKLEVENGIVHRQAIAA